MSELSNDLRGRMAQWFQQRPVFALMGEFSAGKSTLLNMLLSVPLVPAKVTATKLPVIWLTSGATQTWQGFYTDGKCGRVTQGIPEWSGLEHFAMVRITLDSPLLKLSDIVDTPGISDPRIAAGSLQVVAESVDFCIWCTAANQAWRQSEKAAWSDLPARLRDTSILAITRADQLGSDANLVKVTKRLRQEATQLFAEILAVSSVNGMQAFVDGRVIDKDMWAQSGALDLSNAIKKSIKSAQKSNRVRASLPISSSIKVPTTRPKQTGERTNIDTRIVRILQNFHSLPKSDGTLFSIDTFMAKLEQHRDAILEDSTVTDAHLNVLSRCFSFCGAVDMNCTRAFKQVEQEIEDFAKGPWCRLDEA